FGEKAKSDVFEDTVFFYGVNVKTIMPKDSVARRLWKQLIQSDFASDVLCAVLCSRSQADKE
ncbi:MAG: hypothetical protein ACI31W_01745, partial [Lactococcus sp.]